MDTYKVATVANSTSTMHTIHKQPITIDCFETDDYHKEICPYIEQELIPHLEKLRQAYLKSNNKDDWKELIRWLPESWLQKRTWTGNYENLLGMCSVGQRRNHKLSEWSTSFMNFAKKLPYAKEFLNI